MNYNYEYALGAAYGTTIVIYYLIALAFGIVALIGRWKIFTKAGKPGWAAIVPFYSDYCLYQIAFGNGWLFLLLLVPCANFVIAIMVQFKLAKAFRMGTAFGFGLLLLNAIFMIILGFGNYPYYGPEGENENGSVPPQDTPPTTPENPYYN